MAAAVRVRAAREPLLLGLGALAAAGYVVAVDPADGRYPGCPFLAVTGHPCPLCGGLRAVHALGRGDLAAAASVNVMVVVLVVVAVTLWGRRLAERLAGRTVWRVPRWLVVAFAVAFAAFGVLRNLAFGVSLAP